MLSGTLSLTEISGTYFITASFCSRFQLSLIGQDLSLLVQGIYSCCYIICFIE